LKLRTARQITGATNLRQASMDELTCAYSLLRSWLSLCNGDVCSNLRWLRNWIHVALWVTPLAAQ